MLLRHPSIIEEFGEKRFGAGADIKRSMAMTSLLYNPINLITLDPQIAPYAHSERDLLLEHLNYVNAGDLILLDRGYPSLSLVYTMAARKIEFCVRMKEDW